MGVLHSQGNVKNPLLIPEGIFQKYKKMLRITGMYRHTRIAHRSCAGMLKACSRQTVWKREAVPNVKTGGGGWCGGLARLGEAAKVGWGRMGVVVVPPPAS